MQLTQLSQTESYETIIKRFPQLTLEERQLCEFFYKAGINYMLHKTNQVPVLFQQPKG